MPRINAETTVENASYKSMLKHCVLLRPMAFSTPNSQKLSRMFALVEVSKRKKARIRAIMPTIRLNRLNKEIED